MQCAGSLASISGGARRAPCPVCHRIQPVKNAKIDRHIGGRPAFPAEV